MHHNDNEFSPCLPLEISKICNDVKLEVQVGHLKHTQMEKVQQMQPS